jgi:hypothetical protein
MKKILLAAFAATHLAACNKQPATGSVVQPTATAASPTGAKSSEAVTSPKTYDGPFGLTGSQSIAELEKLGFKTNDNTPNFYMGTPPKPLRDATSYGVMATPSAGICRIMAQVPVSVVNGTGDQLRTKTDQLAETMQLKYGKYSEKVNYIGQDVYRRNPQFWMMGLKEESILYAYEWMQGKTDKPLPNNIENIEIAADAASTDSGTVIIRYTFKNYSECKKDVEKHKADSL